MRGKLTWAIGGRYTGEDTGVVTGVAQRLLTMTIPGKPTSSKRKYRLAKRGVDFIAKLAKEAGGDEK